MAARVVIQAAMPRRASTAQPRRHPSGRAASTWARSRS
jgi:hypothetical protein